VTDDDLRAALRASHAGDVAPPFARTLAAARPPRRHVAPLVVLAAAIATLVLVHRRHTPPHRPELALDGIGMRSTTLHLPLDSLLAIPGQDLLATTPDLTRGALP
jgi:hypothetical protein